MNPSKKETEGSPVQTLSIQDLGMRLSERKKPSGERELQTALEPLRRALVVDNDAFFVEFLTELLEEKGYEVIKAYDGKEGMEKLQTEKINIMFVDIVMPKIDGWQLIRYTRKKFPGRWFPIVAVSGTIIEQLDELESIGADYYIAKGPIEKMKIQFNDFMTKIAAQPFPTNENSAVMYSGKIYPRRESIELMEMLTFQRTIMECLGLGILVCDRDTRVMITNSLALDLLCLEDIAVLNCKVDTLFSSSEVPKLLEAMDAILREPEQKRSECRITVNECALRVIITLLFYEGKDVGWVLAMEELETCQEPV